jgi:hypothetical protein
MKRVEGRREKVGPGDELCMSRKGWVKRDWRARQQEHDRTCGIEPLGTAAATSGTQVGGGLVHFHFRIFIFEMKIWAGNENLLAAQGNLVLGRELLTIIMMINKQQ